MSRWSRQLAFVTAGALLFAWSIVGFAEHAECTAPDSESGSPVTVQLAQAEPEEAARDAGEDAARAAGEAADEAGRAAEGAADAAGDAADATGRAAGDAADAAGRAAGDAAAAAGRAAEDAADTAGRAAERGGSLLFALLSWLVVGAVVGALAKLLMPGPDSGGLILTTLLGVAGAIVGGFVAGLAGLGSYAGPSIGGFVIAVLGAMLLLGVQRLIRRAT